MPSEYGKFETKVAALKVRLSRARRLAFGGISAAVLWTLSNYPQAESFYVATGKIKT